VASLVHQKKRCATFVKIIGNKDKIMLFGKQCGMYTQEVKDFQGRNLYIVKDERWTR